MSIVLNRKERKKEKMKIRSTNGELKNEMKIKFREVYRGMRECIDRWFWILDYIKL